MSHARPIQEVRADVVADLVHAEEGKYLPHTPARTCRTCVDGREGAGSYINHGNDTIRTTEFAAIVPLYELAPPNVRGHFDFAIFVKNIGVFELVGHSACGAAQAVIAYPTPESAPERVQNVIKTVALSGADLPMLRDAFLKACEGDERHAANLLSRHLVLVSLDNLTRYPGVDDLIRKNELDIIPLYHMLWENTGKTSDLERYDVAKMRWSSVHKDVELLREAAATGAMSQTGAMTHMCDRPHNCGNCTTCHGTIEKSLKLAPLETINGEVMVPQHIATLIRERRAMYQPEYAEKHGSAQSQPMKLCL